MHNCCPNIECLNYGVLTKEGMCQYCSEFTEDNFHAHHARAKYEAEKKSLDKINKMLPVKVDGVTYKRIPKSAGGCYGCQCKGNCVHEAKVCHKTDTILKRFV